MNYVKYARKKSFWFHFQSVLIKMNAFLTMKKHEDWENMQIGFSEIQKIQIYFQNYFNLFTYKLKISLISCIYF